MARHRPATQPPSASVAIVGRRRPCPRAGGRPAPELAVDEVGDAAEEQADRRAGGDDVAQPQQRRSSWRRRRERAATSDAERAAVEAHAAVPELQDLDRVGDQRIAAVGQRQHVEEDVAQPAADDDAQRDPQDQVVDLHGGRSAAPAAPELRSSGPGRRRSASPAGCRRYRPARTSGRRSGPQRRTPVHRDLKIRDGTVGELQRQWPALSGKPSLSA